MAFDRKLLNQNEDIVIELHPHWMFFFQPVLTFAVLVAILVVVSAIFSGGSFNDLLLWVILIGFVATIVWTIIRFLDWRTTEFVLTTDRVIYRRGLFAKKGIQIPLDRINNVIFRQNFWERIVGAGNLLIESAGETGQQQFRDIRHPDHVQMLINQEVENQQNRGYDRLAQKTAAANLAVAAQAGLGAGGVGKPSVAEELEKLEGLLQRGTITQEEFDHQKAVLLGTAAPPAATPPAATVPPPPPPSSSLPPPPPGG